MENLFPENLILGISCDAVKIGKSGQNLVVEFLLNQGDFFGRLRQGGLTVEMREFRTHASNAEGGKRAIESDFEEVQFMTIVGRAVDCEEFREVAEDVLSQLDGAGNLPIDFGVEVSFAA